MILEELYRYRHGKSSVSLMNSVIFEGVLKFLEGYCKGAYNKPSKLYCAVNTYYASTSTFGQLEPELKLLFPSLVFKSRPTFSFSSMAMIAKEMLVYTLNGHIYTITENDNNPIGFLFNPDEQWVRFYHPEMAGHMIMDDSFNMHHQTSTLSDQFPNLILPFKFLRSSELETFLKLNFK